MPEDSVRSNTAIHAPAFKEWAIICDLLGDGRQSLILRKGGISEGRGGFQFREPRFYLFPTLFHEQIARTRLPADTLLPGGICAGEERISIRFFCEIDFDREIFDQAVVERLEPFHFWSRETVLERFEWGRSRSLKLAFVRVYKVDPVWRIANSPEFGGCKSWVDLPGPPRGTRYIPVINDEEHMRRRASLIEALDHSGIGLMSKSEKCP